MLLHAADRRQAANALQWLRGGLADTIALIRARLQDALATIEAGLDFADGELWRDEMEREARQLTMGGAALASDVVWATMISLFLSMTPLHADRPDRQAAFIANALRLRLAMDGTST